ncbi:MAG: FkbM family methyltransferase [Nitrospirota bacterium]
MAKRLYWLWSKPPDSIFLFKMAGITGQFFIHSPGELRLLEYVIQGETSSLERLISVVQPGDVIWDIGASIGLYTILMAKTVGEKGHVIAFEPGSQSFDRLQDNLRLNGLSNVRSFRKALGERNEKVKFYAGEDGKWCSLISPPANRTDISSQVIEVVRGDDFQEVENLPLPQVIKIDVEGYEFSVLKGLKNTLSQPSCELILLEVHPKLLPLELKPEMILSLLKSLGFRHLKVQVRGSEYHIFACKTEEVRL